MLERFNFSRKKELSNKSTNLEHDPEAILKKYPPFYTAQEIVNEELHNAKKEEKEALRELLEEIIAEEVNEKLKEEEVNEIEKLNYLASLEKDKEISNLIKILSKKEANIFKNKEEILLFIKKSKKFTPEFIENSRLEFLYKDNNYLKKDNKVWWIDFTAFTLSLEYLKELGIDNPTKAKKKAIKDIFKKVYYFKLKEKEKDDFKKSLGPIRNFYEPLHKQNLEDEEE